jgi:outer membrane protein
MEKRFRRASLWALALTLSATALTAQTLKVAIVNAQKAVADTQEIKKDQADLATKYKPRQQDIQKLQGDLQQIQSQLRAPNVTPAAEQQLTVQGQEKQKQLQRLTEDLQADFNQDRQDILGRAGQRMQDVIKKLAESKGLDVVIDISNALYFKPALDMTAEATAAYDKAYPSPAVKENPSFRPTVSAAEAC